MGVLTGCKPRPEVLSGELNDAIFAADFGDLIAGTAPAVYKEAKTFFRNTYPARELKKLAQLVFGRLADKKEAGAVIRLSTGFGGGKTHALMTLWHLANNIDNSGLGTELLPAAGRPPGVTVIGIDAGKAAVPQFAKYGKTEVHSLWGEFFFRAGDVAGLKKLGAADDPEKSPNEAQIEAAFPKGPVLILLDELVVYMSRLTPLGQKNLLGFITNLMSVVSKRPQTVLAITDSAGQAVYGQEAAKIAGVASGLKEITSRKATDIEPTKDEEAQIIVRRLLEKVDASAAEEASAEYHKLYTRLVQDAPGTVGPHAADKTYAQRIVACYPFHPRLLETARDRLGALGTFQRSRGVLRLFARILRDTFDSKQDTVLISAGEINWSSPRIQADLLQRLDRAQFSAAIHADIEKHAAELDDGTRAIHTRVASALLLESIPMEPSSGMDEVELAVAVLRPDEAGPEATEALERLIGVCWHTYPMAGGKGWQFRYDQNVLKQIEERKAKVSIDDAKDRVRAEAQHYFAGPHFKLASWPEHAKQVQDSPQLQLALCECEGTAKSVCVHCDDTDLQAPIPRLYRNAILSVTSSVPALENAIDRAQRLIAAEKIESEYKTGETAKLVREQLQRFKPELLKQFRLQTFRAFNRVVLSSGSNHEMDEQYLGADEQEILAQPQGQRALLRFLEAKKMIYRATDSLDVDRFLNEVLPGATPLPDQPNVFTARAVYERFLAAPNLRLVPGREVVQNTLMKAFADNRIVVRFSDGRAYYADGCVEGPEGQRRRTTEKLAGIPLDAGVLIAGSETEAAKTWLREDEIKKGKGKGEGGGTEPPPPRPPAEPTVVSGWDKIIETAATRALIQLKLTALNPSDASKLMSVSQPLGANSLELSATASGLLKEGGTMSFAANNLKPTHPTKPLTIAQTVFNALQEGSQYEVELVLDFGADGRADMQSALQLARGQAPVDLQIVAEFAKAAGVDA